MKNFFLVFVALFVCFISHSFVIVIKHGGEIHSTIKSDNLYVCMPCGSSCDTVMYKERGACSHCNMKLVTKSTVKFNKIEPANLCNFILEKGRKNILLLDVRTNEEFNGIAKDKFGKLAGAINIPLQDLQKRITELAKYKNKEIVVYCSHSHRSPSASYLLMQNGFTKVTNMQYGMSEWQSKVKSNICNSKLYVKQ
jgi:rhodanese-related sulfurtransferase/DNA-directed RNA polymerase subunit RPC12/RpoP